MIVQYINGVHPKNPDTKMKTINIPKILENTCDLQTAIAISDLINLYDIKSDDIENAARQRVHQRKNDLKGYLEGMENLCIVSEIERLGLIINFWFSPNNGRDFNLVTPKIVRSLTPKNPKSELNLLVDRKNFDIDSEHSFTNSLKILLDKDELQNILDKPKSFTQCLEEFNNVPQGSFQGIWPLSFDIFEERDFSKIFNCGFSIYTIDARFCQVAKELVLNQKQVYKSVKNNFMTLEYMGEWDEDKTEILPTDRFILRSNSDFEKYMCPNQWCVYNTSKIQDFQNHINRCSNLTKIKYHKICLVEEDAKTYLKRRGLLPADYENFNFVSFDIETLSIPQDIQTGEHTTSIGRHQLVSIAVTSNFGEQRDAVFMRSDFSESSLDKLMADFWTHLKGLQKHHLESLPEEVYRALDVIEGEIKEEHSFNTGKLHAARRFLKDLQTLKVVSFNGERYDLPIIFPALLKHFGIRKSTSKKFPLKVIKRGSGIMSLDHLWIRFIDVRNFFPYGSLDQMGKIFNVEVHKLAFPYEAYKTIGELEEATEWPKYSLFHSSLRQYNNISNLNEKLHKAFLKAEKYFEISCNEFFEQLDVYSTFENYKPSLTFPFDLKFNERAKSVFNLDPILYVDSWIRFEELKVLGEVEHMGDYLKHYNLCDTKVTTSAFTKMTRLFNEKFGENLLEHPSLPGVAYRVLWNHFSTKINKPYTIGDQFGWISREIREAILGGLVSVFHRHIECGESDYQYLPAVHYASDGRKYRSITGYDAANLYGYSMMSELPVGQGIVYKKDKDGKFSVQLMSDQRDKPKSRPFSKVAIDWLAWCQNQEEFKDVKIEHALNGGERTITLEKTSFSPDGYCEINSTKHFFQFSGCYWHEHDCPISRNSKRVKKDPQFQQRCKLIDQLCEKHGILHTMKECDWKKFKKQESIENHFSLFLNRKHVTESELLQAIFDDKIFGLVKCSVRSPQNVIDRYMKVNFPPLVRKVTPDESMIDPEIRKDMAGKKLSKNQLTQV